MPTDTLDSTFAALADPTRRAILARLAVRGETSVKELAEPFEMTLPAVSKHLKVFEAWTEPEHFVRWWGPKGYTTPFCTIDLRSCATACGRPRTGKGDDRVVGNMSL
jgi:DNA-binding transcriptional ArsR family regulator